MESILSLGRPLMNGFYFFSVFPLKPDKFVLSKQNTPPLSPSVLRAKCDPHHHPLIGGRGGPSRSVLSPFPDSLCVFGRSIPSLSSHSLLVGPSSPSLLWLLPLEFHKFLQVVRGGGWTINGNASSSSSSSRRNNKTTTEDLILPYFIRSPLPPPSPGVYVRHRHPHGAGRPQRVG